MKFIVRIIPEAEALKAEADPKYAPKDVIIDSFEAEHYRAALIEFRKRRYPSSAELAYYT